MASTSRGADQLRAAADDLDLIRRARDAQQAADGHLNQTLRDVKARRLVTVEQMAQALGINRRSVYKRLEP